MDVPLDARLRAGVAVFNAGHYHAAHDAWEPPYRETTGEERDFLQGLIQYAAAAHHVREGNREGAQGLADSALGYLDGVDGAGWATPQADGAEGSVGGRGLDLDPVRAWLRTCRDGYETVAGGDGTRPPPLVLDGDRLALSGLEYPAAAVAAPLVAEATGYDPGPFETGAEYALADLADDEVGSPFVTLLLDFLGSETADGRRAIIVQRLSEHVQRRRAREDDVAGLFD